jgi:hypothetical protein
VLTMQSTESVEKDTLHKFTISKIKYLRTTRWPKRAFSSDSLFVEDTASMFPLDFDFSPSALHNQPIGYIAGPPGGHDQSCWQDLSIAGQAMTEGVI